MDNKEVGSTIKKYWWVIALVVVAGVVIFGFFPGA